MSRFSQYLQIAQGNNTLFQTNEEQNMVQMAVDKTKGAFNEMDSKKYVKLIKMMNDQIESKIPANLVIEAAKSLQMAMSEGKMSSANYKAFLDYIGSNKKSPNDSEIVNFYVSGLQSNPAFKNKDFSLLEKSFKNANDNAAKMLEAQMAKKK